MKNIFYLILGALVFLTPGTLYGQEAENETARDSVEYAISQLDGASGPIKEQQALQILTECADRGISKAMNALGLAYMQGIGVKADAETAIQWLEKAGENGYPRAYQNLGTMYKYARCGVTQDFEKSYSYFVKAVEVGGISALYDAGYMLYKGLGCTQSYAMAADYFDRGAQRDFPPCMYMLGLCYRNGYGREKDIDRARFWLDRAARLNYRAALDELTNHETENSHQALEVSADDTLGLPRQYMQINALDSLPDINGKYQGILVIYDWSGQYIIKEKILELDLAATDTLVTGMWREDKDTVFIQATFKDGVLHFQNTQQKRTDRYMPGDPVLYEFTQATLETAGSALTGNIRMYSPRTMEPERPMYVSLQKQRLAGTGKDKSSPEPQTEKEQEKLRAYPNPFNSTIQVYFTLEEASSVRVALYNSAGRNVYMSGKKSLSAGEQTLSLNPAIPTGVYTLKVFAADQTWETIVVKKGGE